MFATPELNRPFIKGTVEICSTSKTRGRLAASYAELVKGAKSGGHVSSTSLWDFKSIVAKLNPSFDGYG